MELGEDMAEKTERAAASMGGSKAKKKPAKKKSASKKPSAGKPAGRKPTEMHIRHAANGGYIVKHDLKGPAGQMDSEEHQLPDIDSLQSHVGDNMSQDEENPGAMQPPTGMAANMPLRGGM